MRPIDKGAWPTNPESNEQINFSTSSSIKDKKEVDRYDRAKDILEKRTGEYCHICERRVGSHLAVEHILPKTHFPIEKGNWNIFLLICSSCNSSKLKRIPNLPIGEHYFWPHLVNTLLKFEPNLDDYLIIPSDNLEQEEITNAENLIELYSLNKRAKSGGSPYKPFIERYTAITFAKDWLIKYERILPIDRSDFIPLILSSAANAGFFSIWFYVFRNHKDVIKALVLYPRFHQNRSWYDQDWNPIER